MARSRRQLRELVRDAAPAITAIDTLPVSAGVHDLLVELGFEGSVLKRVPPRAIARMADAQGPPSDLCSLRAISLSDDRGRHALCELSDGQRCWAPAPRAQAGDDVTIAYSRRDACGDLREPRVTPLL